MEFKDRLKKIRHFRGLTQAQLAKEVQITLRSVQNYELGARMPREDIIEKLADALGVSTKAFFDDEEFLGLVFLYQEDKAIQRERAAAERLIRDAEKLFKSDCISGAEKSEVMKRIAETYWTNRILFPDKRVGVMYAN